MYVVRAILRTQTCLQEDTALSILKTFLGWSFGLLEVIGSRIFLQLPTGTTVRNPSLWFAAPSEAVGRSRAVAIADRDSHGIFLSPCPIESSCQGESSSLQWLLKVCPRCHSWGKLLPRHTAGRHLSCKQLTGGNMRKWERGNHEDLTSTLHLVGIFHFTCRTRFWYFQYSPLFWEENLFFK